MHRFVFDHNFKHFLWNICCMYSTIVLFFPNLFYFSLIFYIENYLKIMVSYIVEFVLRSAMTSLNQEYVVSLKKSTITLK